MGGRGRSARGGDGGRDLGWEDFLWATGDRWLDGGDAGGSGDGDLAAAIAGWAPAGICGDHRRASAARGDEAGDGQLVAAVARPRPRGTSGGELVAGRIADLLRS